MEKQSSKIKTTTIKELGPNLPLGIQTADGSLSKYFSVKKWRMKEERELGGINSDDASIAQHASKVLSHMICEIGGKTFEDMKPEERALQISQMQMPDVFYAYIWLRISAVGEELKLNLQCPKKHKFTFTADLETTEVRTCSTFEDALWDYELKNPFEIRGKEATGFQFGPPRWNVLESMSNATRSTGAAKSGIILGSIHGVNYNGTVEPTALAEHELDDMTKRDIERIANLLDENAIGPEMVIEAKCSTCGTKLVVPIDWGYNNFFSISSQ